MEEDRRNTVVEESKEDTGGADTTDSKANRSQHGTVNASKTETVRQSQALTPKGKVVSNEFDVTKIVSSQVDLSAKESLNSPKNDTVDATAANLKDIIPELVVLEKDWQQHPVPSSLQ